MAGLAEIAVEASLARSSLEEMAFAFCVQSMLAHVKAQDVEVLAARIGLSRETAERCITDAQHHAALLGEAHELLKRLIPYEDEVRAIAARPRVVQMLREV